LPDSRGPLCERDIVAFGVERIRIGGIVG